jgi:cold shock CspA family protein
MIGKLTGAFDRGYGWLRHGDDLSQKTFCHMEELRAAGVDFPRAGVFYEFDIELQSDGRKRATNLQRVN